jgi:hypothetical protein
MNPRRGCKVKVVGGCRRCKLGDQVLSNLYERDRRDRRTNKLPESGSDVLIEDTAAVPWLF